ncbi:hypothetical protein PFISCL1PPCAC_14647, partial [Pristionchus fissidentatus]
FSMAQSPFRSHMFSSPPMQPIASSDLFQRRNQGMIARPDRLFEITCERCGDRFDVDEVHVLVNSKRWHTDCFRCAQCFGDLSDEIYFTEGGRFYCEADYRTLYAPVCVRCKEDVIGNVVRAATGSFHPQCFRCEECECGLESGVWIVDGRLLCYDCKENIPKEPRYICTKCRQSIDKHELLRYNHDHFHAYHFDCTKCKKNLDSTARIMKNELFCARCYDLQCDICPDCKHPVDHETERSVEACGKHWHIGHFRCAHCGDPFNGKEYHERRGKAYCRKDFVSLFGDYCFKCGAGLAGDSVRIFDKGWCPGCYSCRACDRPLKSKDKVMEEDGRPMCKVCIGMKSYKKMWEEREKRRNQSNK